MHITAHRFSHPTVLVLGLAVAFAAPAVAASPQISGVGASDVTGQCTGPPVGYEDFVDVPPMVMSGSLTGCWYFKVDDARYNGAPSGVYQERGREIFVGTLDSGDPGTFTTTYTFSAKFAPDAVPTTEIRGRCQHPITAGSGTGGFTGATGRVDFKDDLVAQNFPYRGHIFIP